jgi:hypothetical protein
VDAVGSEPRASHVLSGCDTAAPRALPELAAICRDSGCFLSLNFRVLTFPAVSCRWAGALSTCGLVATTSTSHAEGHQFDLGQVHLSATVPGIDALVAEHVVSINVTRV